MRSNREGSTAEERIAENNMKWKELEQSDDGNSVEGCIRCGCRIMQIGENVSWAGIKTSAKHKHRINQASFVLANRFSHIVIDKNVSDRGCSCLMPENGATFSLLEWGTTVTNLSVQLPSKEGVLCRSPSRAMHDPRMR